MVVWKCFLSLSFFSSLCLFVFFYFYFSIVNNLCRGSELSRDPGSNVCDVRHDCCFCPCYDFWLVVAFPSGEARGFYFPALYGWCLSVLKMSVWVFFQTSGDIWTLGTCAFKELWSGTLNLEYWHWKNASNCKWCIPLKREIRRHTTLCDL